MQPLDHPARLAGFNTQPPEGGWSETQNDHRTHTLVSTHSHPKVAGPIGFRIIRQFQVSTHSHPKVAGFTNNQIVLCYIRFQHTATRRWLVMDDAATPTNRTVSTHSHPKVAGMTWRLNIKRLTVSTHSHPKVAGKVGNGGWSDFIVSTHSHPKVAGNLRQEIRPKTVVSTHSHPKVAGHGAIQDGAVVKVSTHSHPKVAGHAPHPAAPEGRFQHTATRRWLDHAALLSFCAQKGFNTQPPEGGWPPLRPRQSPLCRFNTQPPEGGWARAPRAGAERRGFNTQPPEGGWTNEAVRALSISLFQHTATRRWLALFKYFDDLMYQFQHTATRRWLVP